MAQTNNELMEVGH